MRGRVRRAEFRCFDVVRSFVGVVAVLDFSDGASFEGRVSVKGGGERSGSAGSRVFRLVRFFLFVLRVEKGEGFVFYDWKR